MSVQCRLCGEMVSQRNVSNIFKKDNNKIVVKVKVLTGLWLNDDMDLPRHICRDCDTDLNQSVAFRERCIKTQHHLQCEREPETESDLDSDSDVLIDLADEEDEPVEEFIKEPKRPVISSIVRARTPSSPITAISLMQGPQNMRIVRALTERASSYTQLVVKHEQTQRLTVRARTKEPADVPPKVQTSSLSKSRKASAPLNMPSTASSPPISIISSPVRSPSPTEDVAPKQSKPSGTRPKVAKSLVCDVCGRSFDNASNLKLHLVRHTGVKPFECDECDQKFFTNPLLQMHIRVRHEGQKPWKCRYCDDSFTTGDARSRHERKLHEKITFPCQTCGKGFLTKSCLSKHEFLHTGERPYRCELCDVGFPRNFQLRIHYKSKSHKKNAQEAEEYLSINAESLSAVDHAEDVKSEDAEDIICDDLEEFEAIIEEIEFE